MVGLAVVVAVGAGACAPRDSSAGSPGPGAPSPTFSAEGPCDLAFGASCGPTPTPAGSASTAGRDVSGLWKGTYTCAQGLTGFNLDVSGQGGGAVSAVFTFGAIESNPRVPSGSYSMTGRRDARSLTLTPKAWIVQPPGYVMVGLVADLQGTDPDVLSGTVTNASCTTFRLTR